MYYVIDKKNWLHGLWNYIYWSHYDKLAFIYLLIKKQNTGENKNTKEREDFIQVNIYQHRYTAKC